MSPGNRLATRTIRRELDHKNICPRCDCNSLLSGRCILESCAYPADTKTAPEREKSLTDRIADLEQQLRKSKRKESPASLVNIGECMDLLQPLDVVGQPNCLINLIQKAMSLIDTLKQNVAEYKEYESHFHQRLKDRHNQYTKAADYAIGLVEQLTPGNLAHNRGPIKSSLILLPGPDRADTIASLRQKLNEAKEESARDKRAAVHGCYCEEDSPAPDEGLGHYISCKRGLLEEELAQSKKKLGEMKEHNERNFELSEVKGALYKLEMAENAETKSRVNTLTKELMELKNVDLHSAHERIKDLDVIHGQLKAELVAVNKEPKHWSDAYDKLLLDGGGKQNGKVYAAVKLRADALATELASAKREMVTAQESEKEAIMHWEDREEKLNLVRSELVAARARADYAEKTAGMAMTLGAQLEKEKSCVSTLKTERDAIDAQLQDTQADYGNLTEEHDVLRRELTRVKVDLAVAWTALTKGGE